MRLNKAELQQIKKKKKHGFHNLYGFCPAFIQNCKLPFYVKIDSGFLLCQEQLSFGIQAEPV